jgi:hypothetical protein
MKNNKNLLRLSFLFLIFNLIINVINAQDVFASTMKIGPFKPGMLQKEVEAIILKKLTTKELKASVDNYEKNIKVVLNNVVFFIGFFDESYGDEKLERNYKINKVLCNDPKIRTKSGVMLGMTKFEVMKILDNQKIGYNYTINSYENEDKKILINEFLLIYDDKAGTNLTLEFKNGKVVNFIVQAGGDGC